MKNKTKTIIIIILSLVIIGLVGYIVYDKVFINEKNDKKTETIKTEEKKEEKKEDLNKTADVLMDTLDKSHVWEILSVKENPASMDFNTNMIDNEILYAAISAVWSTNTSSAQTSDLDSVFKIYNIDNLDYKDVSCFNNDGIIYKYNNLTKEYKFDDNHPGHGGLNLSKPLYVKLNNIEKEKENYILTVTTIYGNQVDFEFVAADPKGTIKIADFDAYITQDGTLNTEQIISEYEKTYESKKANYPKYKFTFKKKDNNYYLTKYEIEK